MSYRVIIVDGLEYEYVVGRSHVKIRGRQAVDIAKIGAKIDHNRYAVTPARVAEFIRNGSVPENLAVNKLIQQENVALMKKLLVECEDGDYEAPHMKADDILCKVLRQLGFDELVNTYHKVEKWYA